MKRTITIASLLFAVAACNKPSEEACRKAISNMRTLLGTDVGAAANTDIEGDVRRCKGGSTKKAVECAGNAKTLDDLRACDFMKVPVRNPDGTGAGTAAGTGADPGTGTGAGTGADPGAGTGADPGAGTNAGTGADPGAGTGTNPGAGTGAGTGGATDSTPPDAAAAAGSSAAADPGPGPGTTAPGATAGAVAPMPGTTTDGN